MRDFSLQPNPIALEGVEVFGRLTRGQAEAPLWGIDRSAGEVIRARLR
ncbi:MAG: hypothetical protein WD031_00690 [Gemmatimonadota bacterium]